MAAFIDKVKIRIESGRGGNGMVAWRREKYVDKGGPAGGDGGCGGDIYFVADENMSTLLDFTYKSVFKAQDGENGRAKNQHGKCGESLYIKMPIGVVVRDLKTDTIIADLNEHGKTYLAAKGGRGGRGNARFATSQKRTPQFCEPGEAAVERELELELKLIADVGLLGMPNAGKSSLISIISSARPKVADYPFTTLVPNLGVVKMPGGDGFVVADIPGLIEGASEGVGLGYEFLRHVQRSRFLVHLVDLSADDPVANYLKINKELEKYGNDLAQRYQLVVLNKSDIVEKDKVDTFTEEFKKFNSDVCAISCATKEGIKELLNILYDKIETIPVPEFSIEVVQDENFNANDDSEFEVGKLNKNTYFVDGGKIRRLAGVTDERNIQQLRRFANILDSMGVYKKLREIGIQNEDTIVAGHLELTYWEGYN